MQTFAVSLHFSPQSEKLLNVLINNLADATGNNFRIDGRIMPHLTLGMFHAESAEQLMLPVGKFVQEISVKQAEQIKQTMVMFDRAEIVKNKAVFLLPSAECTTLLCKWNAALHEIMRPYSSVANNGFYLPEYFMPHIALATGLSCEQAKAAAGFIAQMELPITVEGSCIILAQCKPYVVRGVF